MSYRAKFIVCVIIGLIGFNLVVMRTSVPAIIFGFLIVGVVVPFGYYFWARMHQPKNPLEDEIAALTKISEQNVKLQEKHTKDR